VGPQLSLAFLLLNKKIKDKFNKLLLDLLKCIFGIIAILSQYLAVRRKKFKSVI
jgi:hypothetical protein